MPPRPSDPRLASVLAELGHVASRSILLGRGVSGPQINAAMRSGYLKRLRRGHYATASADVDQRRAVMLGGVVGCVSALRRAGVWGGLNTDLHVHVPSTASRLPVDRAATIGRDPSRRRTAEEFYADQGRPRLHWMPPDGIRQQDRGWLAHPIVALRQAILCQDEENALASVDSAIRLGYIDERVLDPLFESLPARLQPLRTLIDPRADSGQESIVRLRLVREGYQVEPQVELPGRKPLDLLIEGVVGLEIDSSTWHGEDGQIQWDFDKTLLSHAMGIPCLRIRYRHVFFEWLPTLAAIQRTVADAVELRDFRNRSRHRTGDFRNPP